VGPQLFPKNWKIIQQVKDATELLRKTGEKWIQNRKTAIENGDDIPQDILTQILKTAGMCIFLFPFVLQVIFK